MSKSLHPTTPIEVKTDCRQPRKASAGRALRVRRVGFQHGDARSAISSMNRLLEEFRFSSLQTNLPKGSGFLRVHSRFKV